MKKSEILWMAKHRCRHYIPYLQHPNCYVKEVGSKERLGFLDIEATNLSADFGIVICYCIADSDSDSILWKIVTKRTLSTSLDKEVVKKCIEDMRKFDRIITYYGTRMDMPFLRTRAVALGLDFPEYGEINHLDLYFLVKNKFKLSSNRLDNVCRTLFGQTKKTRLTGEYWIKALQEDKVALDYILDHCQKDVLELKKLYYKIISFKRPSDLSI